VELCDYSDEVLFGCGGIQPVQYCRLTHTSTRAHQGKDSSAAKTRKVKITNLNTR